MGGVVFFQHLQSRMQGFGCCGVLHFRKKIRKGVLRSFIDRSDFSSSKTGCFFYKLILFEKGIIHCKNLSHGRVIFAALQPGFQAADRFFQAADCYIAQNADGKLRDNGIDVCEIRI